MQRSRRSALLEAARQRRTNWIDGQQDGATDRPSTATSVRESLDRMGGLLAFLGEQAGTAVSGEVGLGGQGGFGRHAIAVARTGGHSHSNSSLDAAALAAVPCHHSVSSMDAERAAFRLFFKAQFLAAALKAPTAQARALVSLLAQGAKQAVALLEGVLRQEAEEATQLREQYAAEDAADEAMRAAAAIDADAPQPPRRWRRHANAQRDEARYSVVLRHIRAVTQHVLENDEYGLASVCASALGRPLVTYDDLRQHHESIERCLDRFLHGGAVYAALHAASAESAKDTALHDWLGCLRCFVLPVDHLEVEAEVAYGGGSGANRSGGGGSDDSVSGAGALLSAEENAAAATLAVELALEEGEGAKAASATAAAVAARAALPSLRPEWQRPLSELRAIDSAHSPAAKLEHVVGCCASLIELLMEVAAVKAAAKLAARTAAAVTAARAAHVAAGGAATDELPPPPSPPPVTVDVPGADTFLPVLIFAVLIANPPRLHSNLKYVADCMDYDEMLGEQGYFYTNIVSAVTFLEGLQEPDADVKTMLKIERPIFEKHVAVGRRQYKLGQRQQGAGVEAGLSSPARQPGGVRGQVEAMSPLTPRSLSPMPPLSSPSAPASLIEVGGSELTSMGFAQTTAASTAAVAGRAPSIHDVWAAMSSARPSALTASMVASMAAAQAGKTAAAAAATVTAGPAGGIDAEAGATPTAVGFAALQEEHRALQGKYTRLLAATSMSHAHALL